jgi:hypothetical protein
MFKRAIIASFVVGAAITAAGPSAAQPPQGDPVYNTYYYSDSSHNEVVGINHGDCTYWGVVADAWLEGQTSAYSEPILVAYCYQGNWQPL